MVVVTMMVSVMPMMAIVPVRAVLPMMPVVSMMCVVPANVMMRVMTMARVHAAVAFPLGSRSGSIVGHDAVEMRFVANKVFNRNHVHVEPICFRTFIVGRQRLCYAANPVDSLSIERAPALVVECTMFDAVARVR